MEEHDEHSQRDDFNQQASDFSRDQLTPEERLLHDLRRTYQREATTVTRSLENVWQRLPSAGSRLGQQASLPSPLPLHATRARARNDLLTLQHVKKRTSPPRWAASWLNVLAAGLLFALLAGTALGAFLAVRQAHHQTASPTPYVSLVMDRAITGLAWSPDGRFFAAADAQGDLAVWKVASGLPEANLWQIKVKTKIWSLAWDPSGVDTPRLALACADGKVRILDAQTGKQLLIYRGHGTASVLSVAWSRGFAGSAIASGDITGSIHVWDPQNGKTLYTFSQSAPVTGLAWGGIYLIAVGAGPGGTYSIWDTTEQGYHMDFHNDRSTADTLPNFVPGTLTAVSWGADTTYIAVGDSHGALHLLSSLACSCWLYETGIHAHHQQINSIAWSNDPIRLVRTGEERVATASDDGTIHLWNVIRPQRVGGQSEAQSFHQTRITPGTTFTDPGNNKVTVVLWSPDNTFLLSGDEAGHIDFWAIN